jgi:biotin-(acetyl-CoA carboxylase) ligase
LASISTSIEADFRMSFARAQRVSRATAVAASTDTRRLYGLLEAIFDICAEHGFEGVRAEFDARFRMCDKRICVVDLGGSELKATALGIDADGALRVRLDDGTLTRIIAGDVTLAKESE